jgi:hypothetical protein
MDDQKLITLAEFLKMDPRQQGYALYMQEELPGSELKGWECPYPAGSAARKEFDMGGQLAVLAVQDSEE